MAHTDIKLECREEKLVLDADENVYDSLANILNPYSLQDTMLNRFQRLKFKEEVNSSLFGELFVKIEENLSPPDGIHKSVLVIINNYLQKIIGKTLIEKINKNAANFIKLEELKLYKINKELLLTPLPFNLIELFSFCISDSIFCLSEAINICNSYGKTYMISNSMIAETHERLVYWCYIKESIMDHETILNKMNANNINPIHPMIEKIFELLKSMLDKQLTALIDQDIAQSINHLYHCEMALNKYYAAKETHTEGKAYKNMIESLSFLNDDFNDKYSHFNIALERCLIANDVIEKKIKSLSFISEKSSLYQLKNYIRTKDEKPIFD